MDIKVSPLPKSQIKIEIELTDKELEKYSDQAVRSLSSKVKIAGFRPGKAPFDVIKAHIGEEAIKQSMLEFALPQTYFEAVKEKKLEVISKPEIKIIKDQPLKYEAKVAVLPEIKVKDLDKIKIPIKEVKITDEEVKKEIDALQKNYAVLKEVERPLKKGDKAEIDFEGFDTDGKKVPNTESKNHPLVIGEGSLIPGFEKELIGLKKGDKKEFTLTFPKDYHKKDFQNKKVTFKIEVKKTEEFIIPEINEEFIQKMMHKKMTKEEFEAKVKEIMQDSKKNREKINRENEFLNKIIEASTLEVPEILVEEEIVYIMEDMKYDIEKKTGLKFEEYLKMVKKDEESIKKEMAKEAEKRVKLRLVLSHIFKVENLEPKEDEITQQINKIVEYYPEKSREHERTHYEKGRQEYLQLVNKMKLDKLFNKYLK
jgi:trigger factor